MIKINFFSKTVRNLCSNLQNDKKKLSLKFPKVKKECLRSSGPGGQNVNQVSSKVQLTCHIDDVYGITNELKEYIKEKHKLTKFNEIVVESDKHKSQTYNTDECYQKLANIFEKYHKEFQFINSVPTKEDNDILEKREKKKAKYRLEEKRRRALKKQSRSTDF